MRGSHWGHTWIRAECPFCEDGGHRDKKSSLAINAGTGKWYCLRCNEDGRLEEPPDPAIAVRAAEELAKPLQAVEPPRGYTPLWNDHSMTFRPARRYLRGRGVTRAQMLAMHVGACAEGYWAGRVIIPFTLGALDGGWWGWAGRLWVKDPPPDAEGNEAKKCIYPKGTRRGTWMYNHDVIFEETDEPLLVVEAVFDAFPYMPHAVASLGKPTKQHVDALIQATRPVALVLDGDAWQQSHALALRLQFEGVQAGCVRLPPKTDPDEVDREVVIRAARECIGKFQPVRI